MFLCWFKHIVSHLRRRLPEGKLALIMDTHTSHESDALFAGARKNNVELISLPSHTSICLQPLHVSSVFRFFKRSWKKRCRFLWRSIMVHPRVFPFSFETFPKDSFLMSKEMLGTNSDAPNQIESELRART